MKFFGQFLMEKGYIDEDALLTALIKQLDTLPSVANFVRASRMLSVSDQLNAFVQQWRTGGDYRESCQILGLWSPNLEKEVIRQIAAKRHPLGQILVEEEKLSLADLSKALDEFIAANPGQKPAVQQRTQDILTKSSQTPTITFDPALIHFYSKTFDAKVQNEILLLGKSEAKEKAKSPRLRSLIHGLGVMANYAELHISTQLWRALETANPATPTWNDQLCAALEIAWGIREAAQDGVGEKEYLTQNDWSQRLENILTDLTDKKVMS